MRLGSVTFQRFEIPETVNFGGKQALTTHKLPGGERIIDAMGRDDDDITWQGRFRGNQAVSRARAVDRMRSAGKPVTLTWGTFRYTVMVESFKADYNRAYEIPYTVNCVVLKASEPPAFFDPLGLSTLLNIDLGGLTAISDRLNLIGVTSVVNQVQTTLNEIGAFTSLSNEATASISSALGGAQGTITSGIAALDSGLTPDAGTSGGNPLAMANSLIQQAGAFDQLADLYQMGSTVSRMAKNL